MPWHAHEPSPRSDDDQPAIPLYMLPGISGAAQTATHWQRADTTRPSSQHSESRVTSLWKRRSLSSLRHRLWSSPDRLPWDRTTRHPHPRYFRPCGGRREASPLWPATSFRASWTPGAADGQRFGAGGEPHRIHRKDRAASSLVKGPASKRPPKTADRAVEG